MTVFSQKKIYLTDLEHNLVYAGILEFYKETSEEITATLADIQVYEYSSSNPLYSLSKATIKRPKCHIHIE
jgi:hypothetical protein